MTQVAIWAARVIVRALMIPIADHTRSKHKDRDEREGNTENAKSLLHRPVKQSYNNQRFEMKQTPRLPHSNLMLDAGKALYVTLF